MRFKVSVRCHMRAGGIGQPTAAADRHPCAQWTIIALSALSHVCCVGTRNVAVSPEESDDLVIVSRDLIVLPVFTSAAVSGFPISARNVLAAAHSFDRQYPMASVAGMPMAVLTDQSRLYLVPPERDWITLYATSDRFVPNIIDPAVDLKPGDRVYAAGFPQDPRRRRDARWHASRTPLIIAGRVLALNSKPDGTCLVAIEVPPRDYEGCSGGPVAIVDEAGHVRVWGVLVRLGWIWNRGPRFALQAARLQKAHIERMQSGKMLHPVELEKTKKKQAS